jgi:hypothetical protein
VSGASQIERAVLVQALDHHPARLTVAELTRALADEETNCEAIERAIGALSKAGLLHNDDAGFVSPTRAAVYLSELLTI